MSEALLRVFDETLDELNQRMKELHGNVRRVHGEIGEQERDLKGEEDQLECAVYEEEEATIKIDALNDYLRRSGEHPEALLNKAKNLREEHVGKSQAAKVVKARVESLRQDVQMRKTKLAVLERNYADTKRQWDEVSELASRERANATA